MNTKYRGGSVEPATEVDPTKCAAYGCPMRASVSHGGGSWQCSCHAYASPDKWQAITRELRAHDWMLGFIGDLQSLYITGAADKPWVKMAREFWAEFVEMQPTANEVTHWGTYLWRLRADLEFRVGVRSKKPVALKDPAPPTERFGNIGAHLPESA